jgi:hypothetical protein
MGCCPGRLCRAAQTSTTKTNIDVTGDDLLFYAHDLLSHAALRIRLAGGAGWLQAGSRRAWQGEMSFASCMGSAQRKMTGPACEVEVRGARCVRRPHPSSSPGATRPLRRWQARGGWTHQGHAPATDDRQHAGNRQQAAGSRQQAAGSRRRSRVADCQRGVRIGSHTAWGACCEARCGRRAGLVAVAERAGMSRWAGHARCAPSSVRHGHDRRTAAPKTQRRRPQSIAAQAASPARAQRSPAGTRRGLGHGRRP